MNEYELIRKIMIRIRIRIVGRFRFDSHKDMKIHVRIHITNVNSRISNTMRTSRLSRVESRLMW